jgi:protein TonB
LAVHAALLVGYFRPHVVSSHMTASSALQFRVVHSGRDDSAGQVGASTAIPVSGLSASEFKSAPSNPSATQGLGPVEPSNVEHTQSRIEPEVTLDQVPAPPALAPAPSYRSSGELDPPPTPMQAIEPDYPEAAGMQEGSVVLRLLISSSGDVDEVAVVRATPPGLFEASALQAFAKAKFSPGYFLGIPVKSQIFIEVGYTPINRGGAVSGQGR